MGRLSKINVALESFTGGGDSIVGNFTQIWDQFNGLVFVPLLRVLIYVTLVMSIMILIEVVYMWLVFAFNYLFGRKTEKYYKWEEFKEDVELGNSVYPLVLIQIPMFNEKEVYRLSIEAACRLSWPSDRIIIQVLDDSTDPDIKGMVQVECEKWTSKGTNIHYLARDNRQGYKAGALKEALEHSDANKCEYVAIFDADFQPQPDFLNKTIPFLHHNHELGLVQARWKFVNSNECLMTRLQEMSLNVHFKVEQEVGSSTFAFFGFNGTAGIWRMAALNEAGGWKDRTTVEDMDLAVRVSLKGWKFLYLSSVKVKNELPSTMKAYRNQQHRWSCGSANLFRKMAYEIIISKKVTLWKKLHIIYSFFFIKKIVAHSVTFLLFCFVLPICVWVPDVEVPTWGTGYIPTIIIILSAAATPRSLYLVVFWVIFENSMSLHRTKAIFIGLFEAKGVNEWVVTEKHGNPLEDNIGTTQQGRTGFELKERLLLLELGVGIILFISGCYDLTYGKHYYYLYMYLQSIGFTIMGLGYFGSQTPRS